MAQGAWLLAAEGVRQVGASRERSRQRAAEGAAERRVEGQRDADQIRQRDQSRAGLVGAPSLLETLGGGDRRASQRRASQRRAQGARSAADRMWGWRRGVDRLSQVLGESQTDALDAFMDDYNP